MEYENECYICGHMWYSDAEDDPCPMCGELDDVGAYPIK